MFRVTPEWAIFCCRAARGDDGGHHAGDIVQEGEEGRQDEIVQGH